MVEIGTSGLQHSGGYVTDEFLKQLQGPQGIKAYREMADNSPIIGSILFAIRMLARETGWRIEPEADGDEGGAEFVDECLHDMSMSWDDTLDEILSCLVYGFQLSEIVYKRRQGENATRPGKGSQFDDGRIGWRKWAPRSQLTVWRWDLDERGGIRGVQQYDPYNVFGRGYIYLPIEKLLLFRPFSYLNNPQGRSILRNAYTSYYYAKQIAEIEAIGIERDLAGLPVIKIPAEVMNDTTQMAKWKKVAQDIKRNEQAGVVLPSDMWPDTKAPMFELTLLSAGGERQINTNDVLMRHETRMAQTVLADFIQLGQQPNGSRSLADTKGAMFGTAMGALLDSIAEIINRHAIPRLFRLNGMPTDRLPRFVFDDIEYDDVNLWAEALSKLAAAGMPLFPDPAIEAVVRAKLDLPEMTEEELDTRREEADTEKERMDREAEATTQQAEMAANAAGAA